MLTHPEHVDDGHEASSDTAYQGPAWYAIDMNGIVAGPFDDADQCDWWISAIRKIL